VCRYLTDRLPHRSDLSESGLPLAAVIEANQAHVARHLDAHSAKHAHDAQQHVVIAADNRLVPVDAIIHHTFRDSLAGFETEVAGIDIGRIIGDVMGGKRFPIDRQPVYGMRVIGRTRDESDAPVTMMVKQMRHPLAHARPLVGHHTESAVNRAADHDNGHTCLLADVAGEPVKKDIGVPHHEVTGQHDEAIDGLRFEKRQHPSEIGQASPLDAHHVRRGDEVDPFAGGNCR